MKKLLVILTRHSPIVDVMPHLEILARPPMTVAFLFPYPVESRSYLLDHWVTTESVRDAMTAATSIMDRYSEEAQKELARKLIAPAINVLQTDGVQVEIHLYSGRLAKAIKNYNVDQDVRWVMSQLSPRFGWMGYFSATKKPPLGWSTYLLSARRGRSFSEKQHQHGHTIERTGTLG